MHDYCKNSAHSSNFNLAVTLTKDTILQQPDHSCYTYNLVPFTTKTFKLTYRKNTKMFYLFEGSTVVCCNKDYDWMCGVVINKLVDKTCPIAYRLKHRIKLSKGYVEWCKDNDMPLVTDGYEPRAYVTLL